MHTAVPALRLRFDASRVNRALADAAADTAQVRLLYDLYPDFAVDSAAERTILSAADRVVLQFPLYWYSTSALLKEWEDPVLLHGWAYGPGGNALRGKELLVATSPGGPASAYAPRGSVPYSVPGLLRPLHATAEMVGMRFLEPFITHSAQMTDQQLDARAQEYAHHIMAPGLPVVDRLD